MFKELWQQWGPQAFLNWLILKFLFSEMGSLIDETYLPILRLLVDDKDKLREDFQALRDSRVKLPFYASPHQRWWVLYGNFIRENEFALGLLKQHLSEEDFEELAVRYSSERLGRRFEFMKKAMRKRYGPDAETSLHETFQSSFGRRMVPVISSMSQFLVGPMDTFVDEDGTLVMEIPDCAMHRSVDDLFSQKEDGQAQELSCLYSCKAACEAVFSANDSMCFEFEPHLPGYGCTFRAYMEGSPLLERRRQALESAVKFVN